MGDPHDIKSIFLAASEKPPAERAAFLDEAVGGDAALRARVEALLKAHDNPDSFLNEPGAALGVTVDFSRAEPLAERPGTLIGPYKLMEQIGEGGMGVVYMADQQAPVRRRVALKIIKPGMDTRQVIARFEAERQALALMDHPNIARVLDAGTTDQGRPYFVMDLVKGVPITAYCDQQHLSVRERMELMSTVCHAVQHAHQKGIIHRDIKPSNVLIAEYDGKPVPKIIDFGVAKATAQRLTERTMFTQYGQIVGTFEYMSPEQARFNQLDVDTRSDIYSLGVLLYEVLAGSTPLEKERLRSAAVDEVLRIICDEDPPLPSLRLSSSHMLPSISAQRQIEPAKLKKIVQGELDWIVMKCLEKDRNRRYETASALAVDLQRFLDDEPVEARAATGIYRLRKFVRRNKAGVLASSAIAAALSVGLAASTYFAASASREAKNALQALEQAEANRQAAEGVNRFFTEEIFGLSNPGYFNRRGLSLTDALDIAAGKVEERFPNEPELRAVLYDRLADCYYGTDQWNKAVEQYERAAAVWEGIGGPADLRRLKSRCRMGGVLSKMGRNAEALKILESTHAAQSKVFGAAHPDTLATAHHLGFALMREHDARDVDFTRDAFQRALSALGPRDPQTLQLQYTYSWARRWRGQTQNAFDDAKAASLGLSEVSGSESVQAMLARYNYAAFLQDLGRLDESAAELKALHDTRIRVLGPSHTTTLQTTWRLVVVLKRLDRKAEAAHILDEVSARVDDGRITDFMLLADAYAELGDEEAALKWTRKTLERQPPKNAEQSAVLALMRISAGDLDGYREACAAMSRQFAASTDVPKFWFAWTCGLGPNALNDLRAPLDHARTLVEQHPQDTDYLTALGILLYRARQYDEAVERLTEAIAAFDLTPRVEGLACYPRFFLATSQWQLGNHAEARHALAAAQIAMDVAMKASPNWRHRAASELFRREAEALIQPVESTSPTSAPDAISASPGLGR